ncbi:restriction endonuclease subunit S [Bacteroides intestinalis]|uniref:restriction endonuclease subunit S n=1 Tax=Bacteroides TaxID=816 RepID=UPI001D085156|nr:restriction endonuclease subunit S [Bacteroides intestinalis]MCB6678193.1 restriction endonuclease subunit S [Bacteroides intestinalis]MCB7015742.1 restriction endonuclease subunit S [Bacteroides intestinalis]MCG4702862.1 restriction endonuclease subunit S [Bacteroides intestinalis]MCG4719050.1 restriction endonuclease subunit S [Bacteroides intestinalis]MCG4735430.1 restriction endonuclease subunit S [Bacteroides intestinalis]
MSRVKFGDVVKDVKINIDRLNNPYEYYVAGDHMDSEDLTIHRKGCFTTDDVGPAFIRVFKPGQILYGSRRTYLKKIAVADFEGVCANTTFVFETKDPHAFEQRLLPFIMLSKDFTTWSIAKSKGSTNPYVLFSDLADFEFELPPLEEQKVLVDKLWAAYRLKEAYKKLLVATDEMVKSQFIEIFYGMETTPVKDYIDDSFPGEWGTEDKDGNGVKVIRTTNFTNSGKLNLADVVTRSIEDRKVVRKQIKKYDTILERSGGTADNPVGRVVLFEEDNLFLCNNFTQVLRFKDVDPRFAFYALYYFYQTNRTAIRSMGSKTTGIQNLNMSKYLEIGIPNASDEDQKAFVTIAEQADKSKFELKQCIENIDKVIKSLING